MKFVSSKDNDEDWVMHSKSDNIEIMINDRADEIIEKPFLSLIFRYEIGLEHQWEIVISFFILFIYNIINVIK